MRLTITIPLALVWTLGACGSPRDKPALDASIKPPCEDIYIACEFDASKSPTILSKYARLLDCSTEFGYCAAARESCAEDCEDLVYITSACKGACLRRDQ